MGSGAMSTLPQALHGVAKAGAAVARRDEWCRKGAQSVARYWVTPQARWTHTGSMMVNSVPLSKHAPHVNCAAMCLHNAACDAPPNALPGVPYQNGNRARHAYDAAAWQLVSGVRRCCATLAVRARRIRGVCSCSPPFVG